VSDYLEWIKREVPNKKYIMVLQAFSMKDQGFNSLLAAWFKDRRPTNDELQSMLNATVRGGAMPCWWGQSMLKNDGMKFWETVLTVTKSATGAQSGAAGGAIVPR